MFRKGIIRVKIVYKLSVFFLLFFFLCAHLQQFTIVNATEPSSTEATSTEEIIPAAVISDPAAPAIVANSAIVIDAKTGKVIYSKNSDKRCYPASITKVMTCLVALEHVNLKDTITFSESAIWGIERDSNHIALDVGETITVEQCLYGILLQSANEASLGIAEHVAGSMPAFADMMNAKAVELGCRNTHFVNANGLHDDNHYTTAYDMALITKAAIENPLFRLIDETKHYVIPPTNMNEEQRDLWHQLKPIYPTSPYYYEYILGGKTGFTDQAKNTVVTYAKKGELELICVILDCQGAANTYTDSIALYDYCFNNYTYVYPLQSYNPNNTDINNAVLANFYSSLNHPRLNLSVDKNQPALVKRDVNPAEFLTVCTYYSTPENNVVGEVTVSYKEDILCSSAITYQDIVVNGELLTWGANDESKPKRFGLWIMIGILFVLIMACLCLFALYKKKQRQRRRRRYSSKNYY